jgi:hypothetical protein
MEITAIVFAVWFAATVIVQVPRTRCRALRKFEPTGHLLPGWHFFSPKPILADMDLLYRCVQEPGGRPSEWRELFPDRRGFLSRMLLSPERRARKALFSCVQRILTAIEANPEKPYAVTFTVPYLLVLDRVTAACAGSAAVQFRIDVARQGPFRLQTAFQSPMHEVDLPVDCSPTASL